MTAWTMNETMRACVFVQPSNPGMGDLVLANGLMAMVRRALPYCSLTAVVGASAARRYADLLTNNCIADHVMESPDPFDTDLATWEHFCAELAKGEFQVCVVHPNTLGLDASHAKAAGIPVRIGIPRGRPSDQDLTHPIKPPAGTTWGLHELVRATRDVLLPNLDLADAMDAFRTLPVRPEPLPELSAGRGWIAVHPVGQRVWNRRWPLDRYVELCQRIVGELNRGIYLLGSEADVEELDTIRASVLERHGEADVRIDTASSVNRIANLIDGVELLVGNDSSLHHVAAFVDTPTVVVYGPSRVVPDGRSERVYPLQVPLIPDTACPIRWSPLRAGPRGRTWAEGSLVVDEFDVRERQAECRRGCSPRYEGPQSSYPRCLEAVGVDEVWSAVLTALGE